MKYLSTRLGWLMADVLYIFKVFRFFRTGNIFGAGNIFRAGNLRLARMLLALLLLSVLVVPQIVVPRAGASMRIGEAWGPPVLRGAPVVAGRAAGGGVVKFFVAPRVPWGPGHRGIDIAVRPGSVVRSVLGGTVTMAGSVAGAISVVVRHPDGSRTGYSFLLALLVAKGERVTKGEALGISGATGPGHLNPGLLHLSWRVGDVYRDPLSRLTPRAWRFSI